jgi:hypothetical protein
VGVDRLRPITTNRQYEWHEKGSTMKLALDFKRPI